MGASVSKSIGVPTGQAALDALAKAIDMAKGGDPLAPVTVIVPSRYSALSIRRDLGARTVGREHGGLRGLANVRFEVAGRVAELLGAPRLARTGRRPRTSPVVAEAVRAAAAADPAVSGPAALHPSTIDRLVRVMRELRSAGKPAMRRLADGGGRGAVLAAFVSRVDERLADWYDELDLTDAAAEAIAANDKASAELGMVVCWAPRRDDPISARLITALAGRITVIEPQPPAPSDPLLRSGTTIVSVPDPDEEVRGAVREILALAESGIPLHRIAIAHPGGSYPALLHEHLTAAGLPHNGPAVHTLANTVAGIAVLGLLTLAEGRFGRDEIMGWLASVPAHDPSTSRLPPVARWDRASRRAGVVAGLDAWRERMTAHIADLEARRREIDTGEADTTAPAALDDPVAAAVDLRDFVVELGSELTVVELRSWSEWARWASRVLRRYLGGAAALARWPEAERDAYEEVLARLGAMAELEQLGATPDLAAFRQAVEAELEAPAGRLGTFGDGPFVGPIGIVGGLMVDAVVVVGAAEGLLPRAAAIDPLLGDHERTVAGLPPPGGSIDDQAHDFFAALGAGTSRRVVFTPRGDLRSGHVYLPSRWILELAAQVTGEPVRGDQLPQLAQSHPEIRAVASFADGLTHRVTAASMVDRDLGELWRFAKAAGDASGHPIVNDEPSLARAYAAEAARASGAFTAFDGRVDPAAAPTLAPNAPLSATALEHYAACPRRFFLGRALRLSTVERPEAISEISAIERGSLVHQILERWVRQRIGPPARAPSLAHLMEVAAEVFTEYERRGVTGRPLRWQYDRQRIERELGQIFDRDVRSGHQPLAAEHQFGRREAEASASATPDATSVADHQADTAAPPLSISLSHGEPVTFRGSIDRIDRAPDGSLVVTDYKTGAIQPYKHLGETTTDSGTRLQLPIYGLAARAEFGDDRTPVHTRYWFVSDAAGYESVGYRLDADRVAAFRDALEVITGGVRAGYFPARPGEPDTWSGTGANCRHCEFDQLCPSDRFRQWERKRVAPELREYVTLAEGADPADEEGN